MTDAARPSTRERNSASTSERNIVAKVSKTDRNTVAGKSRGNREHKDSSDNSSPASGRNANNDPKTNAARQPSVNGERAEARSPMNRPASHSAQSLNFFGLMWGRGNLGLSRSKVSNRICETTRLRTHFLLAGIMNHGAAAVLQ